MIHRFLLLITALFLGACHLPTMQPKAMPPKEIATPATHEDETDRHAFRQGLEEFVTGNPAPLRRLAAKAPNSPWGMAASQLVQLQADNQSLQQEVTSLQQRKAGLERQLKHATERLETTRGKLRELEDKLVELTRVLVELENHQH